MFLLSYNFAEKLKSNIVQFIVWTVQLSLSILDSYFNDQSLL